MIRKLLTIVAFFAAFFFVNAGHAQLIHSDGDGTEGPIVERRYQGFEIYPGLAFGRQATLPDDIVQQCAAKWFLFPVGVNEFEVLMCSSMVIESGPSNSSVTVAFRNGELLSFGTIEDYLNHDTGQLAGTVILETLTNNCQLFIETAGGDRLFYCPSSDLYVNFYGSFGWLANGDYVFRIAVTTMRDPNEQQMLNSMIMSNLQSQ